MKRTKQNRKSNSKKVHLTGLNESLKIKQEPCDVTKGNNDICSEDSSANSTTTSSSFAQHTVAIDNCFVFVDDIINVNSNSSKAKKQNVDTNQKIKSHGDEMSELSVSDCNESESCKNTSMDDSSKQSKGNSLGQFSSNESISSSGKTATGNEKLFTGNSQHSLASEKSTHTDHADLDDNIAELVDNDNNKHQCDENVHIEQQQKRLNKSDNYSPDNSFGLTRTTRKRRSVTYTADGVIIKSEPVDDSLAKSSFEDSTTPVSNYRRLEINPSTAKPSSCRSSFTGIKRESKPIKGRSQTKVELPSADLKMSSTTVTRSMVKFPGLTPSPIWPMHTKRPKRIETEMWLNKRLEQQACILWSSEQKRRFQQQYPDVSNAWLEDKMRTHWEGLSERDRHRYIQRARLATHAEHGQQMKRRNLTQQQLNKDDMLSKQAVLSQRLKHCTPPQLSRLFHSGTAQHQFDIIQHKLWSLQRRMFPTDYRRLPSFFGAHLMRSCFSDDNQSGTGNIVDNLKSSGAGFDVWRKNFEERGRLVIYNAIEEVEAGVDAVVAERFQLLERQAAIQYRDLLADIIDGGDAHQYLFDDRSHSKQLTELLEDLPSLDEICGPTARRDDISCDQQQQQRHDHAVRRLEQELSRGWMAGSTTMTIEGRHVAVPNVDCKASQKTLLLDACLAPTMTPLTIDDVTAACSGSTSSPRCAQDFPLPATAAAALQLDSSSDPVSTWLLVEAAGHVYRMLHGVELCCGLDSPSCFLNTTLALDDSLRYHHQQQQQRQMSENAGIMNGSQQYASCAVNTGYREVLAQSLSEEELLMKNCSMTGVVSTNGPRRCHSAAISGDRITSLPFLPSSSSSSSLTGSRRGGAGSSSACRHLGILGNDTWLTNPIDGSRSPASASEMSVMTTTSMSACAAVPVSSFSRTTVTASSSVCAELNSINEQWPLHDNFNFTLI